jgi:hypothetical protein
VLAADTKVCKQSFVAAMAAAGAALEGVERLRDKRDRYVVCATRNPGESRQAPRAWSGVLQHSSSALSQC